MAKKIYIGNSSTKLNREMVSGEYVYHEGERFYRIANNDRMRPFFMSIVSHSDHWMFISSNGALSAGRKNPDHALFPYATDDKITDSPEITGNKTIVLVTKDEKTHLWEPFSDRYKGVYSIRRNLYKNTVGNKVLFEEINIELGISYIYSWNTSEKFGFVKKSRLTSIGQEELSIQLLDGIQNILPPGVGEGLQTSTSTLVDAYKKNELHEETGLGMFLLSAFIVDKPVPSESLRATTVFSIGLDEPKRFLSSRQLDSFRLGHQTFQETSVRAERGAYFVRSDFDLASGGERRWRIIADIDQGPSDVAELIKQIKEDEHLLLNIEKDIQEGTENLVKIVASSDGLQAGADEISVNRHFSNVLFNVMRGGVFYQNYQIDSNDFRRYIKHFNKPLFKDFKSDLDNLPTSISWQDLLTAMKKTEDQDMMRLATEYLPLIFSRRHGDPSRPWNRFSIEIKHPDGSINFNYEGNWRDIFQNWEALAVSFPDFITGMISKFASASTQDGYNPYRITKEGIDWEVIEPDDPWSFIGYWGDHQIIYLLKLMEIAWQHDPGSLSSMLSNEQFSYANVPYKIKPWLDILNNPRDTIIFDAEMERSLRRKVQEIGADAEMVMKENGDVHLVNFTEKLLVTVLAKFTNFVPEGGIWLNTQRPEWNDANNALVGNGVSMVTLYYLYRFQNFCLHLFEQSSSESYDVSIEVYDLLKSVIQTMEKHHAELTSGINDRNRKTILNELGMAGDRYRNSIYHSKNFEDLKLVTLEELERFFELSIDYLAHSIAANKREDGLYHAYNLMDVSSGDEAEISRLYMMLEGQVSVLSAGILSPQEAVDVMDVLKASPLFREDQYSYILYPDRELPAFLEKNNIPDHDINESELLKRLLKDGNKEIVEKDVLGKYHFNPDFHNGDDLKLALASLSGSDYEALVDEESSMVLDIFEEMFNHHAFTGRSGTFFGYEGLGCIYWHMVSKLLLAIMENYHWAVEKGADDKILGRLKDHYYEIRAGIGVNKSPELFGAFPSDPYSHTPGNAGAQQPGMTGQVKEDILARFGEVGVFIENGSIRFEPSLLRKSEFLNASGTFRYYDIYGVSHALEMPADSFAFTYCQIPVVYHLSDQNSIELFRTDDSVVIDGLIVDPENSKDVFQRSGSIKTINVNIDWRGKE